MSPETCARKLSSFFKQYLAAQFVLDTTFSRNLSLVESGREFVNKYKENPKLTLISGSCPGWICYAEKTHGSFILPYISTVKSPQQIMGSLVKDYMSRNVVLIFYFLKPLKFYKDFDLFKLLNAPPGQIYHVTIMPCFDKKLESSRKDFMDEETGVKDVDCVLSTLEVEELIEKNLKDLNEIEETCLDTIFQEDLYTHRGGGSGGYLEYVLVHAAKELFGYELKESEIVYKQVKNTDFKEVIFEKDGDCKLRFAYAYGFRNIQNIVQKIKKNNCQYQYIEIMACPSGK